MMLAAKSACGIVAQMKLSRFDDICQKLPAARLVIQWGGSHVYKIGPKMFAWGHLAAGRAYCVFKTSPLSFEILLEQNMAVRAPYLTRGFWVQVPGVVKLPDKELAAYIAQSHHIVSASLSKAIRRELGLL
jgi:predicted DNA-binding protein (MmcQ/YjbR family)